MHLSPFFLYLSLIGHVRELVARKGDFDLIDAHVYYPDGVAAALVARTLQKPIAVTARGTDLNLYPKRYPLVGRMIAKAAREVDASITVCAALKHALVELGADPATVHVMRNGVDLDLFRPIDRKTARSRWRLSRRTLLSVGHLIERKGHDLVIQALEQLPDVDLIIAGDGPEKGRLQRLASKLGIADRVRFAGVVEHDDLPMLYSAVDGLVLASSREGWPNVLLEALACGTPVIATRNWGTPEIVSVPEAGLLVDERTPEALARAAHDVLQAPPNRAETRRFAEGFSWDATTDAQLSLFSSLLASDTLRLAA
jgi:glycosyltransferase involved in cell wall biosynthesis